MINQISGNAAGLGTEAATKQKAAKLPAGYVKHEYESPDLGGFIFIPAPHKYTQAHWNYIEKITKKHSLKDGEEGTPHRVALRNAAIFIEFVNKFGQFHFENVDALEILRMIPKEPDDLPIQLCYWLRNGLVHVIGKITNPNF